ncbi:sensor histidine kinase [Actinomycetes bacterium NPDC127524]
MKIVKISFKLGLWFFICMLLIETISMTYLHTGIIHSRVSQELHSLQARGNSHRDVLEISFNPSTLHHIRLMESQTDTEVVITDNSGKVLASSRKINSSMKEILNKHPGKIPLHGKILQQDWKNEQYISTVTSFHTKQGNSGNVFMFKDTNSVKLLIAQLNHHFIFAGILVAVFMLISIFFLSRALTRPLISMTEATKKLSGGNFSVTLPSPSRDELGELSSSIQTLANDLNYLKKERNEFLASISHELRTPLTYVKGYAEIAKRPMLDEEDRVKYLTIIHEEAERLSALLEELFDLARLDQNEFKIKKEVINLPSFLLGIYEKMLPAYKNKNIQLTLEANEDLKIFADPARFGQILINLLDNALKYSAAPARTTMKAFKKEEDIVIEIHDEGIGIPPEKLPYIFDRLYRVDKSRSRETGGFGIGLAIAKELTEAHGGLISAESEVNKGTCFTILLKEQ